MLLCVAVVQTWERVTLGMSVVTLLMLVKADFMFGHFQGFKVPKGVVAYVSFVTGVE